MLQVAFTKTFLQELGTIELNVLSYFDKLRTILIFYTIIPIRDLSKSFTYEHVVIITLSVNYLFYKMSYKTVIYMYIPVLTCLESEFSFSAFLRTRSLFTIGMNFGIRGNLF